MAVRVSGYETQVKVFMLLVVLFLVTANLVTVTFLNHSARSLADEAGARVIAASVSMARELEGEELLRDLDGGTPGAPSRAAARLSHWAAAHAASVAEILDVSGRVLASSQTWRVGSIEAPEAVLDPASLTALRAGRPVLVEAREEGDLTVSFTALGPGGEARRFLRAGYVLSTAAAITRQIRLLTWAQGIGGVIVLLLVLLFTRYVLEPYRALRATAASLEPAETSAAGDDPAFLVASFQGVVEKLRGLEAELERMKAGAPSPVGRGAFLESLSSGVLVLDAGGAVRALNPAGEGILGVSRAEAIGETPSRLFRGSAELAAMLEEAVTLGRGRSREVVPYRLPSGRAVHLGITVSSPPGGGAGALCLFSDLTEIRGVQERVKLKENLARLGELSAGIAHEFRNSLATILGYARLAGRDGEGGESAAAIVREVQGMSRLVDEFLRYAGPARLQKGRCDLRTLALEVAREAVREGEAVEIAVNGEWPAEVQADEALLRQALANLVRNAVEAALAAAPPRRVRMTGRIDGGAVAVEISDSGPGFPAEVLPRLFTPFVTTKDRGTGLGMALAQKVVVSHDGSVEAGNLPEGGARVTFSLPLD